MTVSEFDATPITIKQQKECQKCNAGVMCAKGCGNHICINAESTTDYAFDDEAVDMYISPDSLEMLFAHYDCGLS